MRQLNALSPKYAILLAAQYLGSAVRLITVICGSDVRVAEQKKQFGFILAGGGRLMIALLLKDVSEVVAWTLILFSGILVWIGWNAFIDVRRQK